MKALLSAGFFISCYAPLLKKVMPACIFEPLMNLKHVAYLLLSFFIFALLCNPLHLYFLSDDFDSMLAARQWSGVIHSYRPGSDFLLHTDHLLFGYDARGYHVTNYLLHFATTLVLFYTTKALLRPYHDTKTISKYAFTSCLLFLFYPFHSEPIFWLVGRSSLLAVLFAMASVYFYLSKTEGKMCYPLSLLCLLLGLFSYESIWTLPVIITLLTFLYDKAINLRKKLYCIAGYWLVFFVYLAARFYLTATVIGSPYGTQKVVSFNPAFLLRNLLSLFSRSFLPPMQSATVFVICFALLTVLLIVLYFILRKRSTMPLPVSIIAFFACLLPVISLGIDTHDTESERFLYMPSAFLCIAVSIFLFTVFKNKTAYATAGILIIQVVFLETSYESFAAAGNVVKIGVNAVKSLQNTNTVYCIDLPEQYKGGFIFRNGFTSAVKLFAPQVKNVVVGPHKELMQNPTQYKLNRYAIAVLPLADTQYQLLKKTNDTMAFFVWTDSSLNVYK